MQPTETEGAEKYLVTSLITDNDSEEEITVYGISENSNYAKIDIKDGALISEGYHENENYNVIDEEKFNWRIM